MTTLLEPDTDQKHSGAPAHCVPGYAQHEGPPESLWARHGQLICAIIAGVLLLSSGILHQAAPQAVGTCDTLVGIAFVLGLYFGSAAAIESLREKKLDINLLMILGAVLAIPVGHTPEGALLLFLFTLSGALEHYAMQRTEAAIKALVKLFPKEAIVLDDQGRQRAVPLEQLVVGDRVLVRPGDKVAADGEVVEGQSAVDESAITGECLPREKAVGAKVFAGTLNSNGRLVVRVGKPASDTTLAHIIHLVSQAREEKAPVERLFDRVGSAYTIAVISGSILAFILLATLAGLSWKDAGYRAITLLIVASPCALIISTPVVILSAIASCARRGIVLKGGRHLESLAALRAIVFDKTGTLTTGQVQLAGIEAVSTAYGPGEVRDAQAPDGIPAKPAVNVGSGPADVIGGRAGADTDHALLRVAAALEANSTHPLAGAVMAAAQAAGVVPWPVQDFQQEAGHGLRGTVCGQVVVMGSPALLGGVCHTHVVQRLSARVAAAEAHGETAVVMFHAGRAGVLRFRDTVRPESADTVRRLHALGIRPLTMLTGDNKAVAAAVAGELGLDEVHAELLPQDKLRIVTDMVHQHGAVAMVGDGVNDAPALARATVGIAMGSIGSDAALQAADVVLLSNRIERLPWLIETSRHARRVMRQNLAFAIGVILVLVICSLWGKVGLPLGVVGHEGSTLLVVGNGLRLLLGRPDRNS